MWGALISMLLPQGETVLVSAEVYPTHYECELAADAFLLNQIAPIAPNAIDVHVFCSRRDNA